MKMTRLLKDYEGNVIMREDGKPMTLRHVVGMALNNLGPDERPSADMSSQLFELSVRCFSKDEVDLSIDDKKLIKDRAGMVMTPLVFGRLIEALEGDDKRPKVVKAS